jgi:hypothetical protein
MRAYLTGAVKLRTVLSGIKETDGKRVNSGYKVANGEFIPCTVASVLKPWRCLCRGLSAQITICFLPRLTILHFLHINLIALRTFMPPKAADNEGPGASPFAGHKVWTP